MVNRIGPTQFSGWFSSSTTPQQKKHDRFYDALYPLLGDDLYIKSHLVTGLNDAWLADHQVMTQLTLPKNSPELAIDANTLAPPLQDLTVEQYTALPGGGYKIEFSVCPPSCKQFYTLTVDPGQQVVHLATHPAKESKTKVVSFTPNAITVEYPNRRKPKRNSPGIETLRAQEQGFACESMVKDAFKRLAVLHSLVWAAKERQDAPSGQPLPAL